MTILDEIFKEEYDRLSRGINLIREEIEGLPKGYISQKKIGNNTYFYLQKREKNRIVSKHIKNEELEPYKILIQHRKDLTQKIKSMKLEQQKIAAALSKVKTDE